MSAEIKENEFRYGSDTIRIKEEGETILVEEDNTIYELDKSCMEKKGLPQNL